MSTVRMEKPTAPIPKVSRGGLKGYIQDVIRELKKVQWPTPKETTRLTGVVLAVCFICMAVMFAMQTVIKSIMQILQGGGA